MEMVVLECELQSDGHVGLLWKVTAEPRLERGNKWVVPKKSPGHAWHSAELEGASGFEAGEHRGERSETGQRARDAGGVVFTSLINT